MADSELPKYVQRPGDPMAPQPYFQNHMRIFGFAVDVGYERLNAILANDLSDPTDGEHEFKAVLPQILVTFCEIQACGADAPPAELLGWYPEKDLMFWICAGDFEDGLPLPRAIGWYVPFLWVDQPVAIVEGREALGFPKNLGTVVVDDWDNPTDLQAIGMVYPGKLDALTLEPLVQARLVAGGAGGTLLASWPKPQDAVAGMLGDLTGGSPGAVNLPGLAGFIDLASLFAPLTQDTFSLKQLRSATEPDRACYQAILQTPVDIVTYHGGGRLDGKWELEMPRYDTLKLAELLGLPIAAIPVQFGYWMDVDCFIGNGTVIWDANAPSEVGDGLGGVFDIVTLPLRLIAELADVVVDPQDKQEPRRRFVAPRRYL